MAEAPPQSGNLRVNNAPLSADDASSQALSEALGSSLLFIRLLGVLLVGAFLFSCVFTVNPNEVAIVLRFGKPVGEDRAMVRTNGLHFALPYPIDEIIRIGVGESKVVRASRAWYAIDPSAEATGNTEAPVFFMSVPQCATESVIQLLTHSVSHPSQILSRIHLTTLSNGLRFDLRLMI